VVRDTSKHGGKHVVSHVILGLDGNPAFNHTLIWQQPQGYLVSDTQRIFPTMDALLQWHTKEPFPKTATPLRRVLLQPTLTPAMEVPRKANVMYHSIASLPQRRASLAQDAVPTAGPPPPLAPRPAARQPAALPPQGLAAMAGGDDYEEVDPIVPAAQSAYEEVNQDLMESARQAYVVMKLRRESVESGKLPPSPRAAAASVTTTQLQRPAPQPETPAYSSPRGRAAPLPQRLASAWKWETGVAGQESSADLDLDALRVDDAEDL
jgi:hypothetical protein